MRETSGNLLAQGVADWLNENGAAIIAYLEQTATEIHDAKRILDEFGTQR